MPTHRCSRRGRSHHTVTVSGTRITGITATETISNSGRTGSFFHYQIGQPGPVTECGRLTYTFVIQNTGNAPAVPATEALVTDTP